MQQIKNHDAKVYNNVKIKECNKNK